jgi:hypothetical protein
MVGLGCVYVPDTLGLSDSEVRARAPALSRTRVERFNRCPVCEAWTITGGRLRAEIDCPAVRQLDERWRWAGGRGVRV